MKICLLNVLYVSSNLYVICHESNKNHSEHKNNEAPGERFRRHGYIHATQDELNEQISNLLGQNHQSTLKYEVKAKSGKQLKDIRRTHKM